MLLLLVVLLTMQVPAQGPASTPGASALGAVALPSDSVAASPGASSSVLSFSTYSDSLAVLYGSRDVVGMERLFAQASTLEQRLLARYRLFPVTREDRFLKNLPAPEEANSARELALLSALWAYRVADAPPWKMPTYGRRSERLLNQAKSLDNGDPFVLLVDGQALLYKPALFGGDVNEALARFTELRRTLHGRAPVGITSLEAEVWAWYAMHKLGHETAEAVRQHLLESQPPPLYRQFLTDPP